jgi:hypothetical protein
MCPLIWWVEGVFLTILWFPFVQFGYYGVYEQPPYFHNAVDWVDNDCLMQ